MGSKIRHTAKVILGVAIVALPLMPSLVDHFGWTATTGIGATLCGGAAAALKILSLPAVQDLIEEALDDEEIF